MPHSDWAPAPDTPLPDDVPADALVQYRLTREQYRVGEDTTGYIEDAVVAPLITTTETNETVLQIHPAVFAQPTPATEVSLYETTIQNRLPVWISPPLAEVLTATTVDHSWRPGDPLPAAVVDDDRPQYPDQYTQFVIESIPVEYTPSTGSFTPCNTIPEQHTIACTITHAPDTIIRAAPMMTLLSSGPHPDTDID